MKRKRHANGCLGGRVLLSAIGTIFFDETTVKETPDLIFNGTPTLTDFINQNAAAIKAVVPSAMAGTVPVQFEGKNFLGGSVFNNLIEWDAPVSPTRMRVSISR